jgi:2',3'-cyclic-nucleotide 2'-phosphodiesterase (5'-nucleotidase family)
MLKNYFKHIYITILLFSACKSYQIVETNNTKINISNATFDSSIYYIYKPFKDSLDKIMYQNIAMLNDDLYKKQPNSELGNLMADILFEETKKANNQDIDFAILNYGGIRVPSLAKGNIKILDAYNLMPFENYIGYLELNAMQVQALADSICNKGGWPISHITFIMKAKKATNIYINQIPLNQNKTYKIAIIDYIANGGDGMTFLKSVPYYNTGILFRDAIINYFKAQHQAINANEEVRIKYAE